MAVVHSSRRLMATLHVHWHCTEVCFLPLPYTLFSLSLTSPAGAPLPVLLLLRLHLVHLNTLLPLSSDVSCFGQTVESFHLLSFAID